jgi:ubiquinone biosynthesis protein COQ9
LNDSAIKIQRQELLRASLAHVPFDGWNNISLFRGAKDLGWRKEEVTRLFPAGGFDAALLFSRWADSEMLERFSKLDLSEIRVRDRVARVIRCRLEFLQPHSEAVRRLVFFMMLPGNARHSAMALYSTADTIWRALDDTSTDFNHYTKRLIAVGVLCSTTLFWLDDASPDKKDSWGFLDRRIKNVMGIQKLRQKSDAVFKYIPNPARTLKRFRSFRI